MAPLTILLASPRGFCAGVDRAIQIVEEALERRGAPVYVRHQIVHNAHVVSDLEARGAVFVEDLGQVPAGALVVFSAHGVAPGVKREAAGRGLVALDATCPLVTKVHVEAARHAQEGFELLMVGHAGHQEVLGTMGVAPERTRLVETVADVEALDLPPGARVAYMTQTTLAVDDTRAITDAIQRRWPDARGPRGEDICYATTNRQDATKVLADRADLVLVVGSANSSNSLRMVEVALASGAPAAHLIEDATAIDPAWLDGVDVVGLTSGASAPEALVDGVLAQLTAHPRGAVVEVVDVVAESVHFALPASLRALPVAGVSG